MPLRPVIKTTKSPSYIRQHADSTRRGGAARVGVYPIHAICSPTARLQAALILEELSRNTWFL
jgi:hypothetical protein